MEKTTLYLEEVLGVPVNKEKSEVSLIKDVTFLGFQILRGKRRVSNKARIKFKRKIRELTRRNNPLTMFQKMQELNRYLRGWLSHFRIQEMRYLFRDLDGWIRSRLIRSMQLKKWKKPKKFQRIMIKAGFEVKEARRTLGKDEQMGISKQESSTLCNEPAMVQKTGIITST